MRENIAQVSMFNPIIPQHYFKVILRREACIAQIAIDFAPILDASVIEQAQVLRDDKRNYTRLKALPKQQQPPDTPIAVLERMDALKAHMKIQQVVKLNLLEGAVIGKQRLHLPMDVFGLCGFLFSHGIGKTLVIANGKPRLAAIGSVCLQ